jgi:hypothetical protein
MQRQNSTGREAERGKQLQGDRIAGIQGGQKCQGPWVVREEDAGRKA